MQERQDKIVKQLALQMAEALKKEDGRLARDIAKKEAEEEKKCKEKEAKQKAAIESIAEYRATAVRNLACSYSCFTSTKEPGPDHIWWLWCPASACSVRATDIFPGLLSPSPTSLLGAYLPRLLKARGLDAGQPQ